MSTLAERLQSAIRLRGTSQNKVELAAGMTRGHLSLLATGKRLNVTVETAESLARVLRVNIAWLINGTGPRDVGAPERVIELDDGPKNSRARVRSESTYRDASPAVQAAFDALPANDTTSKRGDRPPEWWNRKLLALIDEDRAGLLEEQGDPVASRPATKREKGREK